MITQDHGMIIHQSTRTTNTKKLARLCFVSRCATAVLIRFRTHSLSLIPSHSHSHSHSLSLLRLITYSHIHYLSETLFFVLWVSGSLELSLSLRFYLILEKKLFRPTRPRPWYLYRAPGNGSPHSTRYSDPDSWQPCQYAKRI